MFEIKIKIYPTIGDTYIIILSTTNYNDETISEWLDTHAKNVDYYEVIAE